MNMMELDLFIFRVSNNVTIKYHICSLGIHFLDRIKISLILLNTLEVN